MDLMTALKIKSTTTENGMATNTTSLNANVDLFFKAGAMRNANSNSIISLVSKAWDEDPTTCLRILFWARDVRGGAGERRFFRVAMPYLIEKDPAGFADLMAIIPEYGRWDDLKYFENTAAEEYALATITTALERGNALCAKWMPRKGSFAAKIRNFLNLSPKQYRKLIVGLTNVVENQMCAKEWNEINFEHVPSLAMSRYGMAFSKNAQDSFSKYVQGLKKGEAKINTGAIYPYDVTKALYKNEAAEEQWKALPNYLEGNTEKILPLVDVSGSMGTGCGGNLTCMDVAISLGLYISERNEGPFKDHFLTFSSNPELQHLTGDLKDRFRQIQSADWGMSTNLEKAYKLILDQAVKHNISQEEMPTQILVLSDMEFDQATNQREEILGWGEQDKNTWNSTAQEMVEKMFTDAGYKVPNIIYWNIQSRNGNVPVRFDKSGTALISGFSPSIMTSLLGGAEMSPVSIMMETIGKERYSQITYETM
jgi:hypothetical protein